MWLLFAFSGPVLWAASTHVDKYLVERYFKHTSTATLMVFTAFVGLLAMPAIWLFRPQVLALPLTAKVVMAVSGMLYMGAMLFYLQAIQTEEASVVIPLFQASAIWSYLLAFLLLGETLTGNELLGGALIVAAGAALSFHPEYGFRRFKAGLVLRMAACTFALALSSVVFKIFAVGDDFWGTAFWNFAGQALFGVLIVAVPSQARILGRLLRESTGALLSINVANELVNLGGGLGVRYALLFAPVAVVQAISSTTTLFVFLFGVLLTMFLPKLGREDLSRGNLVRKGVGALAVAIGVALINR